MLLPSSLLVLFLLCRICDGIASNIDLGGSFTWNFYTEMLNISGKAFRVPGDIYADLQANGIIGETHYGRGDEHSRWVARQDWVYERSFRVPAKMRQNATSFWLHFEGLDGPASVWLNDRHLGDADNQFLSLWLPVDPVLGLNFLRIRFRSPVKVALARASVYQVLHLHGLPPECPPAVYQGECHVNLLRKMQASFSWDWGPSFPSVGIWRPVQLVSFRLLSIRHFSPLVLSPPDIESVQQHHFFLVNVSLSLLCSPSLADTFPQLLAIRLAMGELSLAQHFLLPLAGGCPPPEADLQICCLSVPRSRVQLWWPLGYGSQKLYQLELTVSVDGQVLDSAAKRIAFRSIRLDQSVVDPAEPSRGRLFQFEVNGVPVFLKGSNWVPISSFPARDNSARRLFLLHSMATANMNSVRVWGGGVYESDQFYDLADELGILVWQDFMFACALYPTDRTFLSSVQAEVREQVLRLRHHPSLLCWAGNNENELAVRAQWFPEWGYSQRSQARDYLALYKDVIRPLMRQLDPSRPFLLSSPSNGVETEREGGIARDPGDPAFGDIHFYKEGVDQWQPSNLPIPRCATEFGVQSFPRRSTMLRWIPATDWHYWSEQLVRRQHHPGGVLALPAMVFQHFPIPLDLTSHLPLSDRAPNVIFSETSTQRISLSVGDLFMDQLAFLSQLHQAIALRAQIEHYRRWRSQLDAKGLGRTMCAMYWQLNDVWAAPTWSTIDFDLHWKMGHYFVRRSFAPIITSMAMDYTNQLRLFTVSDLTSPVLNATLRLKMFILSLGFRPIFSQLIHLPQIAESSAKEVEIPVLHPKTLSKLWDYDWLVIATLFDSEERQISPEAFELPNRLRHVGNYGRAEVIQFQKETNTSIAVTISATNVLPIVWLDLSEQFKQLHPELLYYFEQNAFAMTTPTKVLKLNIFINPHYVDIQRNDIVIDVL